MSRDQKSPQEWAAIQAEVKKQKAIQAEKDARRVIRNGQIIIFVIAGWMVLSAVIEYTLIAPMVEIFYVYTPFFITFLLLGIYYYRNPYNICVAALCIYGGLIILGAAGDPSSLAKGILIKILIIGGLVNSIRQASVYNMAVKKRKESTDILDEDFTI